jgi:hypothetical protein
VKPSVARKERRSRLRRRRRRGKGYASTTRSAKSRKRRPKSVRKQYKWNESGDRKNCPRWSKNESRPKLWTFF